MASDSIKRKIAALLKLTLASGCTEAEALAAAEKAATLMAEHGLSETDIVIAEASVRHPTKGRSARDRLWSTVSYCTNTAATVLHEPGERGAELVFVGRDPGPEIAAYLFVVLNRAIDAAIEEFKAGAFFRRRRSAATRRAATQDFTMGMVARLARRLVEIFKPQISPKSTALARSARDERYSGSTPIVTRSARVRFDEAASSGWTAGNRVNLAPGVRGTADAPQQIGRR